MPPGKQHKAQAPSWSLHDPPSKEKEPSQPQHHCRRHGLQLRNDMIVTDHVSVATPARTRQRPVHVHDAVVNLAEISAMQLRPGTALKKAFGENMGLGDDNALAQSNPRVR